jgi:formylglycine-generating enzyme required for sulfatase activity
MVEVVGAISSNGNPLPPYLTDKYEVTNEQYFQFVSAGGYNTSRFWDTVIVAENRPLPWASARRRFLDQTGLPGPRFWTGGRFPEGKERHPVVGVSWYEAMAYARWAGKDLPNADQWWFAALAGTRSAFPWGDDVKTIPARANFKLIGTEIVGSYPLGVSPFGCYDMAGNVKEWLRERSPRGLTYTIVGGSWRDESYMFEAVHAESFEPIFSTRDVGFRCVKALTVKR